MPTLDGGAKPKESGSEIEMESRERILKILTALTFIFLFICLFVHRWIGWFGGVTAIALHRLLSRRLTKPRIGCFAIMYGLFLITAFAWLLAEIYLSEFYWAVSVYSAMGVVLTYIVYRRVGGRRKEKPEKPEIYAEID
jgi:uncharacterized membrane protein